MPAGRVLWRVLKVLVLAVLVYLVASYATRGRHTLPTATAPDTSHASWRGYDSGYEHPSSRTSEDANAKK